MAVRETVELSQIMAGAVLARAMCIVGDLGIADLIERGQSRPASELAAAAECDPRSLYRTMRFLASYRIFEETEPGRFALTPLAEALRSDADGSFRPAARMFARLFVGLQEFEHSLRTGESGLTKALGEPLFSFLANDPEMAAIFDAAMTSFHGPETPAVLDAYDLSGLGTLADIGGGNGSLLIAALNRHANLNGLLFDLGHVAGRAREHVRAAGLEERCRIEGGNFFESIPPGAGAYLFRHIIHDWSDEQAVRILENCRAAIPADGRLLVVETVVPAGNEASPAKDMDIQMLIYPGGMERTEDEYRELFRAAGFEMTGVTSTASPVSIIEGRPV